ncbi:Enamine/imine deaminase, partial [Dysosmobacter welbionis]
CAVYQQVQPVAFIRWVRRREAAAVRKIGPLVRRNGQQIQDFGHWHFCGPDRRSFLCQGFLQPAVVRVCQDVIPLPVPAKAGAAVGLIQTALAGGELQLPVELNGSDIIAAAPEDHQDRQNQQD